MPIVNLASFDVVGVRKDGGVDLVVSCDGPLDELTETLGALEQKIRNYVNEVELAKNPTFFERYGIAPDAKVTISVSCVGPVPKKIELLIEDLQPIAARIGARINLIES